MSHSPKPAPADLLTVFVGGVVGTAVRAGIGLAVPPVAGVPVATWGINGVGAFLLGWLLTALTRTGPERGRRRTLRLGIGTGGLGGFTTYSTLATDTASLTSDGAGWAAAGIGYAVVSVVVGFLAAAAGMRVATAVRPGRGDVAVEG